MLSHEEILARQLFYKNVFPESMFDRIQSERKCFWSVEEYERKVSGLKERGFKDPTKMIASWPAILSLGFDNIDAKITGLKERGFKDPAKMITSLPVILGYSFDNIDAKIVGLKERGFKDPVKMITSMPANLDCSFDNIDRKIRFARRIGYTKFPELIACHPILLGLSIKRYFFVARTLREHKGEITFSLINRTQKLTPKGD